MIYINKDTETVIVPRINKRLKQNNVVLTNQVTTTTYNLSLVDISTDDNFYEFENFLKNGTYEYENGSYDYKIMYNDIVLSSGILVIEDILPQDMTDKIEYQYTQSVIQYTPDVPVVPVVSVVEQLQDKIYELQKQIEILQATNSEYTDEINALKSQILQLQAEVERLDTENDNLENNINVLTNQINTLEGEKTALEEQLQTALEEIANLNKQIEILQATNTEYADEINSLKSQISQLEAQISELQTVNKEQEAQISELQTVVDNLTAYIDTATGVTITTNGTYTPEEGIVGWNEVIVNVEGSGNCDEIIEELNAEITQLQSTVSGLTSEVEEQEAQITQLTGEVEEKQAFIDTATGVTITTNGTYTPEEGVVGWNEVIVNVEGGESVVTDPLPIIDNPDNYFYIQSAEDNNIIYFDSSNNSNKYDITTHRSKLEYSYDGTNWTSLNGVSTLPLEKYGDYIFIRNVSTTNITPQRGRSGYSTTFSLFGAEYPVKVGGNAQKLLSNYANPTSVRYSNLFGNWQASGDYKYDNIAYFDIEIPNGTSVSRMFFRHNGITTLPTIERLSVSGTDTITNFYEMFYGCISLAKVPLFDTSNGTNFGYMFSGCYDLTEVPLFDTSNGTNFSSMFDNCHSLKEVPLFDTSNGTNFSRMFTGCISLAKVPLFDTSNSTNFSNMFSDCYDLTEVPLFDTSNGTNFGYMFSDCSSLTEVPLFDTSNGTIFFAMFRNSTSLTEVPQLDTSNCTNFNNMFYGCPLLTDVTFVGSINKNIDFSYSPLLSYDSIKSILTACAATTNTTAKTLSFANIVLIKEIVGEDVVSLTETCLSKGWTISGLVFIEEPAVEESEYFYIKALNPLQSTKVIISNDTLLYEQKPYYEFSLDAINWFDLEPLKVSEFALDENDKLYLRAKENIENNNTLPIVDTSDYVLIGGRAISLLSNDNTISNMKNLFKIKGFYGGLRLVYSHCNLSYSNNLYYVLNANPSNNSIYPTSINLDRLVVVNLNNTDTSNCTDFYGMFYNRQYLKQIIGSLDITNYIYESQSVTYNQMFYRCYSLTDVTFVDSINSSIDFSYSKSLTYDSIKSILTACAATTNTTAKTLKFDSTIADTAGELATLVSSCTSKGWTISGLVLE